MVQLKYAVKIPLIEPVRQYRGRKNSSSLFGFPPPSCFTSVTFLKFRLTQQECAEGSLSHSEEEISYFSS